jgi:hemerythrin
MALAWSEVWSVGVAEIDAQHRALVEQIAALTEASRSERPAGLHRTLDFLGNYVVEHFGTEERLMEEHAYPAFPAHKREHDTLVADWGDMRDEYLAEGATPRVFVALNLRLAMWLTNHVFNSDKELGRFLVGKGVR